jgi:quercetin dioxygenase-like cupin family protein
VWGNGEWRDFGPGSVVFVPPDEEHQFQNTGPEIVKFICLVPKGGCPVGR